MDNDSDTKKYYDLFIDSADDSWNELTGNELDDNEDLKQDVEHAESQNQPEDRNLVQVHPHQGHQDEGDQDRDRDRHRDDHRLTE